MTFGGQKVPYIENSIQKKIGRHSDKFIPTLERSIRFLSFVSSLKCTSSDGSCRPARTPADCGFGSWQSIAAERCGHHHTTVTEPSV